MSTSLQTPQFGSGILIATPSGGNAPTNPTPVQIGVLQNVKLTFSGDIKKLKGQLQYAVDSAVADREVKGSFQFAQMSLNAWNNLVFGELATSTGGRSLASNEPHAVPATTPYTINITPPGSGTFSADAGVIYATGANAGNQLVAVASNPTAGEYSISNGVYTFSAADEGAQVQISYYYTTTTGQTLTVNNHTMGWGPIVSLDLTLPYQGFDRNIYLPSVRISKLDLSTKQNDYTMTDTDFEAFATPGGVIAQIYLPQ